MFKKAERSQSKIKLGITGPSGGGKTYTSLLIAQGMSEVLGGKIAVIDTENGSASLYAGLADFDVMKLTNFATAAYIQAIKAAEKAGYKVLVIDSITHQWLEMLERKALMDARGGNSFHNWNKLTPEHEQFKAAILNADLHIICTIRSKQDYAPVMNDNGKMMSVQKVGLAPIQREGLEYELTAVFDLAMNHSAVASKDRTGMFSTSKPFIPTKETGVQLIKWLNEGVPETNETKEVC